MRRPMMDFCPCILLLLRSLGVFLGPGGRRRVVAVVRVYLW
jgi:hypothetical protein